MRRMRQPTSFTACCSASSQVCTTPCAMQDEACINISPSPSHSPSCMLHVSAARKEDAEVVSMKLLEVLLECLRSPAGPLLSDDSVCAMVGECFNVRGKTRYNRSCTRFMGIT